LNNFNLIRPKNNETEKLLLLNQKNKEKTFEINQNENNFQIDSINKTKDLIIKQEKVMESKYNCLSKARIFRPSNTYNFSYNDPLKIYFNLIEYGMNKDISFQKNLIELLKKKGLVDDTKDKDTSNLNFQQF